MDDVSTKSKDVLEQELAELYEQIHALKSAVDVKPEYGLGKGDPSITRQQLDRAMLKRLERRAQELEEALGRLTEGTYGMCEICGKPIDPNRLAVLPDTKICIACARKGKSA